MSVEIRKVQPADCPRLLELINELAVYEKAPNEVTITLEHFTKSGFGESPVWWGFVAVEKDAETLTRLQLPHPIIGMAIYYIRYSTWKGQRLYLEDIIVTENARGRGIGGLLLGAIIAEAKSKNFNGINFQVLNWNEPAINFYKKYSTTFDDEWVNVTLAV